MGTLLRTIVVVLCFAIASAAPLSAADDDPPLPEGAHWRLGLEKQLKSEKACSLNEVLMFQEVPLGDDVGLDGRVSCFDGREFTFTRKGKHQPFKIEVCAPSVC
jgi:hypothetical protein